MTYRTEFFNLNAIILEKIKCIGTMLRYTYPWSFPRFLKIGKWGSDDKEMSHSSGASYAPTIVHASRKDNERREDKCILATCGIWKHIPRQSGKFIGTGSLIKDFFPRCDKKNSSGHKRQGNFIRWFELLLLVFQEVKIHWKRTKETTWYGVRQSDLQIRPLDCPYWPKQTRRD